MAASDFEDLLHVCNWLQSILCTVVNLLENSVPSLYLMEFFPITAMTLF